MRRLVFLNSAQTDLQDIYRSVAEFSDSRQSARRLVDRLRGQCRRLSTLPGTLGRPRDELAAGLRSMAVGNYVIFFRYLPHRLEVVNILHGRRDIDALFSS